MPLLLFGPVGWPEMLLIGFLIFIIFGAKRLPLVGQGLGEGIRNFKRALFNKEEKAIDSPDDQHTHQSQHHHSHHS